MANAFLKLIGGTSSITSGPSRSINQVGNEVNFGQFSIEHATGKGKRCSQPKSNNTVTFQVPPRSTYRCDSVCE
jgi:hypothetical protein